MNLTISKADFAFQKEEQEKRAAELAVVNKALDFQNEERQKRAAELIIANRELAFQNEEKEKRAAELIIANRELVIQNDEKEKRAAELIITNKELAFQNEEKEKRAAELIITNTEHALQYEKSLKEILDYKYALDESSIVAITDQKGIIRYANDNFCKISKYSRDELVGQDHRIINSGFHPKEFIRQLWTIIAKGEIWRGDIRNKAKDGSTYWVETTIVPFLNDHGKPYQYVAVRSDITQRKQTEEQFSENIKQLERTNKELEQFSYIASHDLQEPLRTVSNYLQVFEEDYLGQLDEAARHHLSAANNAVKRMGMLITSLLDFSRLGHSSKFDFVDIGHLIQVVVSDLDTMIRKSNAIIEVSEMPQLNVYEVELRQVFQNLITNAIKFQKKDSRPEIKIRSEKINEEWTFSVHDNGIGIAPVHFERVFNIFQRLHSNEEFEGNGIGLSNCKKIIQSHHGKIWIESNPVQGTTFYFTLPNQ